ncbi:succinyl-diaminopimelate desuccinylase [Roseomonas sp. OT10]|uniref:succinyl-diaminopimelate desuccinylase n=1 Tax=Roseomonas cutis TaxID=2897332 RepID=UPI001E4CFD2A|nr:succinyl-diaminopimelate desuccinylase [Roseomonas sp. OT10]UFN50533.1 succinyl-diaminopimelate desuccinylase [Roseomonas sp. OT10]
MPPADPLPLAQALIRCRSVTPADDGALAALEAALAPLGFACTRLRFGETENLFARRGTEGPHLCLAGHTDVVPPGEGWRHDPFAAVVEEGVLYGRGAVDMKGGVAAFAAAVTAPQARGSLSFLITGDEEGDAKDGTVRVLEWMAANGHTPDMALVGEPTSKARLGDTIKIGRRGSITAYLTVFGTQGHVAYPARCDNPVHRLVRVLHRLTAAPLDEGTEWFEPSSLQVTTVDVGNPTTNLVPAEARATLNIRFNNRHSAASLERWIRDALEAEAPRHEARFSCSGEAFLTEPGPFVEALQRAVERVTGQAATLDTGGGTSDARFITRYCPVAELGAVGTTMHQRDECTPVAELRDLAALYAAVIAECLG